MLDIGSSPIIATINKNLTFKKIFVIIYMLKKYKRKLYIAEWCNSSILGSYPRGPVQFWLSNQGF